MPIKQDEIDHKMTPPSGNDAPALSASEIFGKETDFSEYNFTLTLPGQAPAQRLQGMLPNLGKFGEVQQAVDISECDHFDLSPSCQVGVAKGGLTFEKE